MLLLCTTSSILSSAVFYYCLRSSSQLSTATLAADHSTEYVYVLDRQQCALCNLQFVLLSRKIRDITTDKTSRLVKISREDASLRFVPDRYWPSLSFLCRIYLIWSKQNCNWPPWNICGQCWQGRSETIHLGYSCGERSGGSPVGCGTWSYLVSCPMWSSV